TGYHASFSTNVKLYHAQICQDVDWSTSLRIVYFNSRVCNDIQLSSLSP
ncbi:11326_t:CDS:1, partial [Gigaspora rosea]